jgi:hypothetical protein
VYTLFLLRKADDALPGQEKNAGSFRTRDLTLLLSDQAQLVSRASNLVSPVALPFSLVFALSRPPSVRYRDPSRASTRRCTQPCLDPGRGPALDNSDKREKLLKENWRAIWRAFWRALHNTISKMLIIKHAPNLSSRTTGAAIPVRRPVGIKGA